MVKALESKTDIVIYVFVIRWSLRYSISYSLSFPEVLTLFHI